MFAPLGYDWQLTVGVLTSFLAREVFVSTMSVLLGGTDDPDLADTGVIARIRGARRDDGSLLFTPATSASALVFFVLAMQCTSTLAVTRQETGSIKWAGVQLAYMSALAYVAALITYQGLRAAGIELRIAMTLDWQTVVVSLVALAAALVVVRRFVPARRRSNGGGCRDRGPGRVRPLRDRRQGHQRRRCGRQRIRGAHADDARRQRRRPARVLASATAQLDAGRRPSRADRRRRSTRRTSRRGR